MSTLCHELVGDGLQQLWLVFLGADEVSVTGRSGLSFQLHPAALLLGLHLPGLVLFDTLQEAVPAL